MPHVIMLLWNGRKDTISVHTTLVTGGYVACVVSVCFSILLVFLTPGPVDSQTGALRYISDGMNAHCGFTTAVLGTCSLLLFACQLIAGAHMEHSGALLWAIAQALGWNVVLGVVDTGWTIHYMGLALFLVGNLAYNFIACRDPAYGGPWYTWMNGLSILASIIFAILAAVAIAMGGAGTPQSFAVAFEFLLLLAISAQNAFLVNALDQFQDIHIQFQERPPPSHHSSGMLFV